MRWLLAVFLLLAAVAAPSASAAQATAVVPAPAGDLPAASCAGPPCGYIQPIINLDIAGKKRCKQEDRSDCYALPAQGESLVLQGVLQYFWRESEDGLYPQTDPDDAVVITFTGTASNPKWLTFQVEPDSFTIGSAELADPSNHRPDQGNGLYFWFERPLTITVTHSGDPTQAELDRLAAKGGVQQVLVKAKADASGAYYREGFGVEDIRFEASFLLAGQGTDGGRGAPAGGLFAVALLPLAAAAARRWRAA